MTAAGRSSARNRATRPSWDTVAIVGVGLIGGSLGLALKRAKAARQIVGISPDAESLRMAKRRGAVDRSTTNLVSGVQDAEMIVICAPVGLIGELALKAAAHCPPNAIITDAGSTKVSVVRSIAFAQTSKKWPERVSFVPGHPIAGGEKSGPEAAAADLFTGRQVILTPAGPKNPKAVRQVRQMWEATGAKVSTMQPATHDELLAAASHLPHAVATALSASVSARERRHSAGGLADTTRVASGNPKLWQDIFRANADEVIAAIDRFQSTLTELRDAIDTDDQRTVTSILRKAKRNRDAL